LAFDRGAYAPPQESHFNLATCHSNATEPKTLSPPFCPAYVAPPNIRFLLEKIRRREAKRSRSLKPIRKLAAGWFYLGETQVASGRFLVEE